MTANERYKEWLAAVPAEDPLAAELKAIGESPEEINDRFFSEIAFGTAGLRGKYGAGTDRMNAYTVGRATAGIAEYILSSGEDYSKGVVMAFDCRYHSEEFAQQAAEIFAAYGIKAYLFPSLRPTPELSFAIRELGALSGVNLTASHNPKEYNGYKVYWQDGAQISGTVADGMSAAIAKRSFFDEVPRKPLEEAKADGTIVMLGEAMDRAYLDYVLGVSQRDENLDKSIRIVYTPLHGAGSIPVMKMFAERGFVNAKIVEAQKDPDPEFSTVGYPNPEDPKGFAMAEEFGKETDAELLIATDPDSDRMAVEIRLKDGSYKALNGNQTGAMLIAYMAQAQKEKGTLTDDKVMVKSIVTGDMGAAICKAYGIAVDEALTGFKNICGRIPVWEERGKTCFFAYEESIGCAPDPGVRDKDGISASMLIAEMAAWYKAKGMTLEDALEELYKTYGAYAEDQVSLILEGIAGQERIARIMNAFRGMYSAEDTVETPLGKIGFTKLIDYKNGYEEVPASNVLKFLFSDGSWFAMRPSGTEPKLKYYYYAVEKTMAESEERIAQIRAAVDAQTEAVE